MARRIMWTTSDRRLAGARFPLTPMSDWTWDSLGGQSSHWRSASGGKTFWTIDTRNLAITKPPSKPKSHAVYWGKSPGDSEHSHANVLPQSQVVASREILAERVF